jgi:hypothetical protein
VFRTDWGHLGVCHPPWSEFTIVTLTLNSPAYWGFVFGT